MNSQQIARPRMLLGIRLVTRSYLALYRCCYLQFLATRLIAEALVRPVRAEDRHPSCSSEILTGAYGETKPTIAHTEYAMDVSKAWRTGLVLCLLSTAAVGQDLPDTKLSIMVYDVAQVGSKTLERSERLAGTILLKSGIQSRWDAGPVEDLGDLGVDFTAYLGRECQAGPISGILRLQILPHAPDGRAAQALGFSLPCARRGVQVTIYADRVADVSETGGPTFGRVLAYVMVHELGHLLLHSGRHEDTGLMKGIWSKNDWQRAAVSIISFSPSEARQIAGFLQETKSSQLAQLPPLEKH